MDEIAKKLAELADKYGPYTIEAVRGAAIVEAWSNVQGSILCIAFTIGGGFITKRLWANTSHDDIDIYWPKVGAVVIAIISIIIGIIAIDSLTDPWLWVTFNNPDYWIAKKVFKL